MRDARTLKKELEEAGKDLVPILEGNLVDAVWGSAQPQAPATSLRPHKLEFAGQSVAEKVEEMQKKLEGDRRLVHLHTCLPDHITGCTVIYMPADALHLAQQDNTCQPLMVIP